LLVATIGLAAYSRADIPAADRRDFFVYIDEFQSFTTLALANNTKFVSAAALALIGCLVGFNSANAQGAAVKATPTTKILAIGTINPGFEQSQVFAVLPEEVRETVDLYLDGKIEQWYSLQGKQGVAFIINVTDPAVAHEMLEKLPLGKAHMMNFELIPIGPLNPLRFLQGMRPKP
jgi:hypothetical protein